MPFGAAGLRSTQLSGARSYIQRRNDANCYQDSCSPYKSHEFLSSSRIGWDRLADHVTSAITNKCIAKVRRLSAPVIVFSSELYIPKNQAVSQLQRRIPFFAEVNSFSIESRPFHLKMILAPPAAPVNPLLEYGGQTMLWTIAVILILMWVLGMVSSYTIGGFIHILLLLALISVVIQLNQWQTTRVKPVRF
jgi:hypothetical protein